MRCLTCGEEVETYKKPCPYCGLEEFETPEAYYRDGKLIQKYKEAHKSILSKKTVN